MKTSVMDFMDDSSGQGMVEYGLIIGLVADGILSPVALASLLTIGILVRLLRIIPTVDDWQELDAHGHYVRKMYFLSGIAIVLGIVF